MKSKVYYAVTGAKIGVYKSLNHVQDLTRDNRSNYRKFNSKEQAEEYVSVYMAKSYRKCSSDKDRLKLVSRLSDNDKNLLYRCLTKKEINHYRTIAARLIISRFKAVNANKEVLDYLTQTFRGNISHKVLMKKYGDIDLSLSVYSMKAIINAMGGSDFSKKDENDASHPKAHIYYNICCNYWSRIWWDTDTGKLSKEQIESREFSEYHLNANKVATIASIRKKMIQTGVSDFSTRHSIDSLHQKELERKQEEKRLRDEDLRWEIFIEARREQQRLDEIEAAKLEKKRLSERGMFLEAQKQALHEKSNAYRLLVAEFPTLDSHLEAFDYNSDYLEIAILKLLGDVHIVKYSLDEELTKALIEKSSSLLYEKNFKDIGVGVLKRSYSRLTGLMHPSSYYRKGKITT